MSRPGTRWARDPVGGRVHLLEPGGGDAAGALASGRCGVVLALVAVSHDQPPPGPPCEGCSRIYLEKISGVLR
ncbi:MAG: hypothetical protein ACRDS0_23430 [Pseudonocardiaceae bacterium]